MTKQPDLAANTGGELGADAADGAETAAKERLPAEGLEGGSLELPTPTSTRYPDHLMPFVGSQQKRDERFADAVEAFLVNYGYHTARAYRADLDDIYRWAVERGLDFFELTEGQIRQYQALLRRRGYSEGTVRRRGTAWRGLTTHVTQSGVPQAVQRARE